MSMALNIHKAGVFVCLAMTLLGISEVNAAEFQMRDVICALCGKKYSTPYPVQFLWRGIRLDFKPAGMSSPALAVCPKCGYVQHAKYLTKAESTKLRGYIQSPEYKAMSNNHPSYYRLAKIYEVLGKNDLELGFAYLRASWQEEQGGGKRDDEMRECLAYSLKHICAYLENGPYDVKGASFVGCGGLNNYKIAQLLKAELLRRLERFEDAEAYLKLLNRLPRVPVASSDSMAYDHLINRTHKSTTIPWAKLSNINYYCVKITIQEPMSKGYINGTAILRQKNP